MSFQAVLRSKLLILVLVVAVAMTAGGYFAYSHSLHPTPPPSTSLSSPAPSPSPTPPAHPHTDAIASFSAEVASFYPHLDGYPPRFDSKVQEKQVRRQWQMVSTQGEALLTQLQDQDELFEMQFQLGELYRMGHNLDNPGSWEKSEQHFKAALDIDPHSVKAKSALWTLYVNTGIQYAPTAESLFLSALQDHPDKDQTVSLYQGLVFARIYQGNFQGAVDAADAGLAIDPQNQQLLTLKNIYGTRLKQGQ